MMLHLHGRGTRTSNELLHHFKNSGEGCVIIFPQGVVNKLGLYILDIKILVRMF
jgi:hypothetical protein